MSGENRRADDARGARPGIRPGWLLPVIVVAVGAYFLITGMRRGTLKPAALGPANWAGVALMLAGAAAALICRSKPLYRLLGVLLCGVGAVMVICL